MLRYVVKRMRRILGMIQGKSYIIETDFVNILRSDSLRNTCFLIYVITYR